MCDGRSPASCTMYSPRSVSTLVSPAASNAAPRSISSVAIDLLLTTVRAPRARARSSTMRRASAGVGARWTCTPRATSACSRRSSQPSRSRSVSRRIAAARSFHCGCAAADSEAVRRRRSRLWRACCSTGSATACAVRSWKSRPGVTIAWPPGGTPAGASRALTIAAPGPTPAGPRGARVPARSRDRTGAAAAARRDASGTRGRC